MRFLRRLGLFAFPLGIALLGILGFSHSVHAADSILSSVYQDSDNDGDVDRIRWTMDENITACAYESGDWTVNTAGSVSVVITGLSGNCNGTDAILYVTVTADANETGGATDPVISYANVGGADSITLTSGAMTAKASQTATDNAAPVLRAVAITDTTCGTTLRNAIKFTYTENVQFSTNGGSGFVTAQTASTATFASMTSAKTLVGIATWDGASDMVQSGVTNNLVAALSNVVVVCFNQPSGAYYSAGSTAPTTPLFTAVSDVAAMKDMVGLAVNGSAAGVTATVLSAWDVTKPTITNTYSCDTNLDTDINLIEVHASESLIDAALSTSFFEGDNDSTNDGVGEHVPSSLSTSTLGCLGSADADANDENFSISFALSDGVAGTDAAYLNIVAGSVVRDYAGNIVTAGSGLGTENDESLPVLMSSVPLDGATGVSRSAAVTLTFSEAVTSVTADTTPTSTTFVVSGAPGAVITLTHAAAFALGANTLTVSVADDTTGNPFGGQANIDGAIHPFTFTVISSGSSGYTPPSGGSYSLVITAPTAGDAFTFGESKAVTWTSTGSAMSYVSLYYSTDGGTTYHTIATDTPNDGLYDWTVPDINSSNVTLYMTGSDLTTILANDVSDIFTVHGTVVVPPEVVEAPSSGKTGISPVTGLKEDISEVHAGEVVRGLAFSTVYYIDDKMVRHPYMDAQTYFTYYENFGPVTNVTNATLPTLPLGSPVLPKVGVTLVKIQSDNKVFALGATNTGTELRWVPSESIALSLYGQSWSDYIIDIPPTLFPKFTVGVDMTGSEIVDRSVMKTRFALTVENPKSDNDGDGISNEAEIRLGTSINDADTDNDGYPDGLEVGQGHDPLTALDSDHDGYPDYIEILHGYDPYKAGGAKL